MHAVSTHLKRHLQDIPFIAALVAVFMIVPVVVLTVAAQTAPVITVAPAVPESAITENTALIAWRTDVASTSVVEWGETTSLEGVPQKKIIPIQETEVFEVAHTISIWGLSPGTTYYYRVKSVSESGDQVLSGISSFTTAVPPFTGIPLGGVSLTSPTAGSSSDGIVIIRALIDGSADSVQASMTRVAGGEPILLQLAKGTDNIWFSSAITLKTGEWLIVASATGSDTTGNVITLESIPVSVMVLIPEPIAEKEPEPVEEDASKSLQEIAFEPGPVVVEAIKPLKEPESVVKKEPGSVAEKEPEPVEEDASKSLQETVSESGSAVENETEPVERRESKMEQSDDRRVATLKIAPLTVEVQDGIPYPSVPIVIRDYDETTEQDEVEVSDTLIASISTFVDAVREATDAQGDVDVTDEMEDKADAVIERALKEDVFVSLSGVMSVTTDASRKAKLWASETTGDETRSKAVVVIDTDSDGLPDDYELAKGLDPYDSDSDNDGTSDAEELRQGSDPLGTGSLARELDPTEKTIVFQKTIAQPSDEDTIDETWVVSVRSDTDPGDDIQAVESHNSSRSNISNVIDDGSNGQEGTILHGTCEPDSTCILYVYSYIPVVLTTTTEEDGSWTYDLADNVLSGEHTVYVAVTDDTGKIKRRSNPLSFLIPEARAITVDDVLDDISSPAQAFTEGSPEEVQSRYLFGTGLVVVVGIVVAALVLMRPKRKRKEPDTRDG